MWSFKVSQIILFISVLLFPTGYLHAQTDPAVSYLIYNVDITLQDNGDFHVREIQRVRYEGEFSEGFAEIPLDYVTDISNIMVYGGLDEQNLAPYDPNGFGPGSYSIESDGNTLYIDWEYDETKPGDELAFVVEYVVKGGMWIYPESDILEWRAVTADRGGLTVPSSRVTIELPFSIEPNEMSYSALGPEYSSALEQTSGGQQIVFDTAETLLDGTAFQVIVEMPHGLVTAAPQPWQIAEDQAELEYRIPSVEVDLVLGEDGNLKVTEKQTVAVDEGTLYEGFRRFTWLYLEGLDEIFVSEGDVAFQYVEDTTPLSCEDCFTVSFESRQPYWVSYSRYSDKIDISETSAGGGEISWRVPPLVKGEEATFTLEYDASGVVFVDEEHQQLHWTVLPGYDVPVKQASVRLFLPNGLGLEDVDIEGGGLWESVDDHILLTLDQPAADWSINVTFPPGATSAEKPDWQFDLETVFAEAEQTRVRLAREALFFRSFGLFTAVLIVLGGLAAWYLKWSRKVREIRGQYRTTPPSDLAPGLVAYIVDEKATAKGALATILHLATLGLIRIDIKDGMRLERLAKDKAISGKSEIVTPTGSSVHIDSHIVFLYDSLTDLLPIGEPVMLDNILPHVQGLLPQLYAKMSQDLVVRYHEHGDLRKRSQMPKLGYFAIFALFFFIFYFARNIWYRLFITQLPDMGIMVVILVIVLFAYLAIWIVRSQRSNSIVKAGQKESKRWLGFKAYLQDIQKYGDLEEAQEILDRYFDYAVALGVEERLLEQMQAMGGMMPVWLDLGKQDGEVLIERQARKRPWYYRPWYQRGSWSANPSQSVAREPRAKPSSAGDSQPLVQQVSDNLINSLSLANQDIVTMLNTASGSGGESVAVEIDAFGSKTKMDWEPGTPVDQVISDIMRKSQTIRPPRSSTSAGGGFRSGSGGSRFRSSSSGRSRSSGSRRSGGGGRRGFR